MILLDTNVVSEPLRPAPDARVVAWIDAQALETLYLSAITVAELRAGVAQRPAGKRRSGLQEGLETRVLPLCAGRLLAFDPGCTQACAAPVSLGLNNDIGASADRSVSRDAASPWRGPRVTDHCGRHGVIRGIQRGTAARNASYSLPNVCSSVGSSYATTKTWKASHNSAP